MVPGTDSSTVILGTSMAPACGVHRREPPVQAERPADLLQQGMERWRPHARSRLRSHEKAVAGHRKTDSTEQQGEICLRENADAPTSSGCFRRAPGKSGHSAAQRPWHVFRMPPGSNEGHPRHLASLAAKTIFHKVTVRRTIIWGIPETKLTRTASPHAEIAPSPYRIPNQTHAVLPEQGPLSFFNIVPSGVPAKKLSRLDD